LAKATVGCRSGVLGAGAGEMVISVGELKATIFVRLKAAVESVTNPASAFLRSLRALKFEYSMTLLKTNS
jgi:hypothetical protein